MIRNVFMCLNGGKGEDSSKSTALYVFLVPSPDINIYKTLYLCSLLVFFWLLFFFGLLFALRTALCTAQTFIQHQQQLNALPRTLTPTTWLSWSRLNILVCVVCVSVFLRYFEQQIKQKYKLSSSSLYLSTIIIMLLVLRFQQLLHKTQGTYYEVV